jgi:hypothetical protein
LRVLAGKRVVWNQERRFLPERRIDLPFDTKHLGSTESLAVDFTESTRP